MLSIFKKEINLFFSSLIAYIAIGVFLLSLGLFMWVFPETSLLDYGFASMNGFFSFAPNIFMFLIPAITMRSFAEETQTGTIELLATKPLTDLDIILGKFFACLVLVLFALLPTLLYYFTIYQLGAPKGNIDAGEVAGSYIGLFFLAASFVAIGLFSSSITKNQIVAFILGMFMCFFFFMAFDFLSGLPIFFAKLDDFVQMLGINYHYNLISRGAIDSRDVIYFLSIISVFLLFTKTALERRKW
ncbi:MAG: gliding motility-associated ABC transporter permease subunit GldF [Bacteroidota bacterium]